MKNVQDIYPLSPLQKGLLFHALFDSRAGAYVERVSWSMRGEFDVDVFRSAWENVVRNQPILRTAFLSEGLDEPLQVVRQHVELPWELFDWRGLDAAEQSARFDALLDEERRRGFTPSEAPLMRLKLVCLAPGHYRFLWSYHHLLLDGWSIPLVLREVAEGYETLRRGYPPPRAGSRPYRDYIAWLQRQDMRRAETYWREALKGFTTPTQLGVGGPATRETFAPEERYPTSYVDLSDETFGALQALVRQHQLTLNPLVQGAWALLLSRYSGEEDVLFGSVVSGRPSDLPGAESMVGLFINTLPLRVSAPPEASLLGWLQQLQRQQVEMRRFEYSPLTEVQRWSPVRPGQPLFESIAVFRNLPVDESLRQQGEGLRIDDLEHHDMATGHPLTMGIVPEKSLRLQLTYDRERYDEATIRRMLGHMTQLLESIVADPHQSLKSLPMLTAAELGQLAAWNDTTRDYPHAGLAHERFARRAAEQPGQVAVSDATSSFTYGELDASADRLAHLLVERGVRPGSRVGVLLGRTAESVVALLAIWKAGGVYLPLDPTHPAARLSFVLGDALPEVLITRGGLPEGVEAGGAQLIDLDAERELLAAQPHGAVGVAADERGVAYVIYTSGSTGEPKGVEVEHRQLLNTLDSTQELFRFTERDVVPCIASMTFDISLFELLCPLLEGGRVLLVDAQRALEAEEVEALLSQVTFWHSTPGLMRRMLEVAGGGGAAGYPQVRALFVGGDAVAPELVRGMRETFPHSEVFVGYGPTEAAIVCALHRVADDEEVAHQLVGRPLGNVRLRLLDAAGREVPAGIVGEIYIGGAGVARGYLNREELTRERFVTLGGERYYKSGDLGRWLSTGVIEFAGRADEQVKVRGYRVETGEVEAALASHAGVKQAVVVARADASGERRLVAYYVAAEGTEAPAVSELREHARRLLPDYMVPSVFVPLDALPLTQNGKVDHKALPAPEGAGASEAEYVAPRTATEEMLAGLWSDLLGVGRIGVADNFFELGGHSLLATQLMSRVREAFSVEVALRELFEQPTVERLAEAVEEALRRGAGVSAPPIVAVSREGALPLSFAQQRLWFIDQMTPGSATYNVPIAVSLTGRLDVEALRWTLGEVVRRHEALRTIFSSIDGRPTQLVHPPRPVPLPLVDLGVLPDRERHAEGERLAAEEARRPFDLAAGPLLRATLLRLAPEEYVMLFNTHHIVSDGWSMGVLIEEVAALYKAYLEGRPSPLPELKVQYADYAAWQRGWLQGEVLEQQVGYWREQLAGAPPVLELPTDYPRGAVQTHRGDRYLFTLPAELSEVLKELSRREGVTLFMTLLAGWQLLLSRYSGQEDVVVGTPIANRHRSEVEPLIGFFVNTLALRAKLDARQSFRGLLAQVKEVTLGAYAHQDLPFEKLVEELQPERRLSHTPLFQVMFALQNAPIGELNLPGLQLRPAGRGGEESSHYDLALSISESGGELKCSLGYSADLFEAGTAERLALHYARLLGEAVAAPDRLVSELEMLTAAELEQLAAWNDTARDYPRAGLAHERFARRAAEQPGQVAVSDATSSFTYGELDASADRLAHLLVERGVRPGARVGVLLGRTAESVVALLAVWKAGGVYLPLDPTHPAARLSFVLGDALPQVLITRGGLSEGVEAGEAVIIDLDSDWEQVSMPHADGVQMDEVAVAADGRGVAYVIYTSGSTGEPKGVEVEHRQLLNTLDSTQEIYRFTERDVVPCFAPLTFDISLFEVLSPLLAGGRLVLVDPRRALEAEELGQLLTQVTFWHSTPGLMRRMLEVAGGGADYSQVRGLFVGGDAVAPELVRGMRETFPHSEVFVGYGPTEAAIVCAAYRVADGEEVAHQLVGRPLGNVRLRLLDSARREVPVGVVGEIYIGGAGVALGYLNREELTRERFVTLGGERYYKSGDLGRWLSTGVIEFAGRADEQVKVRGFRVEIGEVEAALVGHVGVKQAVVVARGDGSGERRLVAYYVAAEGREAPAVSELREHARRLLPDYMVPSVFMALDAMPLTALGKVERKALPAPEGAAASEAEYVAPRTATEEMLAGIWGDLLSVKRVGVADNFFELGGHSLLATQLMSRVREAFSVEVPLRELFEQPTLGGLALAVEEAVLRGAGVSAPPIVPVGREGALPLSFAQQRLWFIDQLDPHGSIYNSPVAFRLTGRLDVGALRQTLGEVVRRHEALRTTFASVGGQPTQVIRPAVPAPLPLVDLSELGEGVGSAECERLAEEEGRRPFDLAAGPLLRATLLRLGAEEHIVLFNMHHIISDAWSVRVLVGEVAALYGAYLEGRPSPLPELKVQYADYAAWQREWLQGEVLEQQVGYWREQLAGAPPVLELPTDRPRPAIQSHSGARYDFRLSAELTRELHELSRREGVTLFMTLLAGWQLLLSRYSGHEDVVVGTPIANRHRAEVEPLIGFFVNMLVLRSRLDPSMSFRDLLARAREACLGAYAHQDVPFEKLVEELQPERSLGHSPLFQVAFGLEQSGGEGLRLPGLELNEAGVQRGEVIFDLSLALLEADGELAAHLEYDTGLFDGWRMERMAGHYLELLREAVNEPGRRVSEMRMLTAPELEQIEEWNSTKRDYERRGLVHQLFERQAAARASEVAVSDATSSLSYGELDASADRLAHLLVERGVRPGSRVGVLLGRTAESVVALLAIWKAGGVYLPLDPAHPAARLSFVLGDALPQVLITRGRLPEGVESGGAQLVDLDAERELLAARPLGAVGVVVDEAEVAYVIYTSGSTGEPKGVEVEHRQLLNTLDGMWELYRFTERDVVPCLASMTFDISLFEVLSPLLAGGRLVLVDARHALEAEELGQLLSQVTFWHSVPGLMRRMLEVVASPGGDGVRADYSQVRALFVGGDAVAPELLHAMRGRFPRAEVFVAYGPTEAAIVCALHRVADDEEVSHQLVGRPLGNVRLRLLDAAGREVPAGVVGEIYIGGAGVARGYLNREELTRERFVTLGGERYYKSGDLGRWLANGVIEFAGRADEQVKVRGYRVETGEVEAALVGHAGVKQAVVVARADASGERRLVAYYVAEDGAEAPTAGSLRGHARRLLPEYMVPSVFMALDAMPLSQNGKVDHKALPAPEGAGASEAEYVAPRTATEEMLAGLWSDLLGVGRVGVADNFFELGGHSLLATQLMSRVREAFSVEVALRELFEQPTLGRLALAVEEAVLRGAGVSAAPLVAVSREGALPVSFAQQRLWFFDQLEPNSSFYNSPGAIRLHGELNVTAMEATYNEIVRRHEVLRTTFTPVDGQPMQVIHPHSPRPLPLVDLTVLDAGRRQAEASGLLAEEAARPFDLARGPLLRPYLIRLAPDEHWMCFTMHHIVTDEGSMAVLVREVAVLYEAFSAGRPSPLPELSVQYVDYAVWQRNTLQGEELERQLRYWRRQLAGAPPMLRLPTDRPRPVVQTFRGRHVGYGLDAEVSEGLRGLSRREGVTLFMTLLAAFDVLLMRYSGQEDVVVGSAIANRTREAAQEMIGFLVNMVAMRTRLQGDPTFIEVLRQVRETALGAYAHQEVPFEKIVEELGGERQQGHPPVFQVAFGVRHARRDTGAELSGLSIEAIPHETQTGRFDLTLWVAEGGEQLRADWIYNTDLFDEARVEQMNRHFERLLRSVVEDAGRRVSELEMRTQEEVAAEEEGRQARVARNASKLKGLRRQAVVDVPPLVARAGELVESVAGEEQ